ncbi:DNA damage-binding protein 2 [Mytilus galloprovincialis]|uniref:DNA damage-binding protein 2 n=1 Tax=Mytilus galloprovincialis TaxID=29158 RepID=A0A8B6CBJ9_MYTGA|nr:DNA damage-binding protein 2 [Mytilus galloprovincialis]
MPEKVSKKRKTKVENEEKKETYSKRLRKKMIKTKEEETLEDTRLHGSNHGNGDNDKIDPIDQPLDTNTINDRIGSHGDIETVDKALLQFKCEPKLHGYTPLAYRSQNLVHFLQQYTSGQKRTVKLKQSLTSTVVNMISDLQLCRNASPFDRRVTTMEWHPTNPNILAVGSKGGDIMLWDTANVNNDKMIQGIGAGGNIQAIKFWPNDSNKILASALDGRVTLHDVEGRQSNVLADSYNFYDFWYCSVDVNDKRKMVVAGDNVGNTQLMTYEGKQIFNCRLHKQKVTHAEFSPREEWLLCTSSTDQTVQFWDVRMMKDRKSSLYSLKHDKGINSGKTLYIETGKRTKGNQVRVYRAPDWVLERKISHPHRFFQHITPIKATWHPLQDLAVIGRYPDPKFPGYHAGELRSIDILDVETGDLVTSLSDPSSSGLVCVNKFNRRGDTLASGMGVHILLWTRKEEVAERQKSLLPAMQSYLDNSSHSNQSSRRPRQPKSKETKPKEKTNTKTDKEKLKLKIKNSKK